MKTMVLKDPNRPITQIHHDQKVYRPHPKTGEWQVEDGHVETLRAHGLMLKGEAETVAKAAQADTAQTEVARLKAVLAAAGLDAAGKPLPKK